MALASGQNGPTELAVDSTSVYWTSAGDKNASNGAIMRVPLGGGAPEVLASGQNQPFSVAVDETDVYWANYGGNTVMRTKK